MKNYNHNTFDKKCISIAKYFFSFEYLSEKMVIFKILEIAKYEPFIQRQAFADRVHYHWLLMKIWGLTFR